ncbi:hypothetical protein Nmel_014027 [Mimus melanotis]
MVLIRSFSLL